MEALTMVAEHARKADQLQAVLRQADMIARASLGFKEENDTKDVQERYRHLLVISEIRARSIPAPAD
jgi:uncharacterized membrane protein